MQKFTDDELKQALKDAPTTSNRKLASLFGVDESAIRRRKKRLARGGWSPEHNWTNTVPEGYHIKGVSSFVDGQGNVLRQWVKSDIDKERQLELMQEVIKGFCDGLPKYPRSTIMNESQIDENLLVVLPIGDYHCGMLAWGEETGEDWDLTIAARIAQEAFTRAIEAAPNAKECLIINLGDWFHAENAAGVTTKSGHHLDMDSRFPKMIRVGIQIKRCIIALALAKYPTVRVRTVGGNHDGVFASFLSACLANVYENEPRIIIEDAPTPVHCVQWGKVLIATTHGDTIKPERLAGVVACDYPEMWGTTKHRYGLLGHVHHSSGKDYMGMYCETFRTLIAKDAYAAWGGYRAPRDTQVIVYHKEYGEVERHKINIDKVRADDSKK